MARYFGAHVSAAGGLENAIRNAVTLGVNAIQIHPSAPQRWTYKPFAAGIEAQYLKEREEVADLKVFFHAIYLINLANPDPQQFQLSKQSLQYYLELGARMQINGLIFHVGSLKDQPEKSAGLARAAEGINWIMQQTDSPVKLLLEVAAGGGMVIGARLEELSEIYSQVEQKERVGFALDTQHMWASGYDFKDDLQGVISNIEDALGFDKIGCVHLNDSKTELASRKDRHENLGQGLIGEPALRTFFNHPKLVSIPFILETPDLKDMQTAGNEVAKLRTFLE